MAISTPTAPLILLASPDEIFARSLESVLTPTGYAILRTFTAASARAQAQRTQPDALILATDLTDATGLQLCRALRGEQVVTDSTPILLTHRGPSSRSLRLEALRAGADELWGEPLDSEEVGLRLAAQLRSKFDADRARRETLVDDRSTLWNDRGLLRRADELLALMTRHRDPVTVAVLATDVNGDQPDWDFGDRLAVGLRKSARLSDAVGRLGPARFAVIAPGTGPAGGALMGKRLLDQLDSALGQEGTAVRVGFASVDDATMAPRATELVRRATDALHGAGTARVRGWSA